MSNKNKNKRKSIPMVERWALDENKPIKANEQQKKKIKAFLDQLMKH